MCVFLCMFVFLSVYICMCVYVYVYFACSHVCANLSTKRLLYSIGMVRDRTNRAASATQSTVSRQHRMLDPVDVMVGVIPVVNVAGVVIVIATVVCWTMLMLLSWVMLLELSLLFACCCWLDLIVVFVEVHLRSAKVVRGRKRKYRGWIC